jgi:small subunit ribosomal protein S2
MISDKAFANELEEVRPLATESHFIGEDGDETIGEVHESAGTAEASIEDVDDDNIDLNAALGGGIRKAPAAADAEPEVEAAEVSA